MSIAIHARRLAAPAGARTVSEQAVARSPREQLQDTRAIIRHLVLATMAAGSIVYGGVMSGALF